MDTKITTEEKLKGAAGFWRERGAALITALLFLVILTGLGLASVMTSGTELMISRNYRINKVALDYANGGVNMALARMNLPDTEVIALGDMDAKAETADPATPAWGFSSSNPGASIAFMNFTGTVEYKKETGLHQAPGYNPASPRVVGYSVDCQYTKSPIATYSSSFPVYEIRSTGKLIQGGVEMASATVVVEVSRNTLNLDVPGGFYSETCPNLNGSTVVTGGTMPGVVTSDPTCTPDGTLNGTPGVMTNISTVHMSSFLGMPIAEASELGESWPPGHYANGAAIGTTDAPILVTITGNDTLNNITGTGILIVTGDLTLGGCFQWDGLVYVVGNITQNGGGGCANVNGALMAGGLNNTLNGGLTVTYDEDILDSVATKAFKTKIINWRRIYN